MDEEWEQDTNAEVEAILDRWPEAREFLPLISASTTGEFEQVASAIAQKVRAIQSNGSKQAPSPTSRAPKPDRDQAVSVKDAIDSRDWPGFLAARWIQQNEQESARG